MQVREATLADADAVGEVHVLAWQHAYRGQLPDAFLDALGVVQRQAQWRRRLTEGHPTERVLVAETPEGVAGFVVVGPTRDHDAPSGTGEVMAINLHPDRWRQGIGRALLERGVEVMRESGFRRATLWVLRPNDRARGFYEAMGWAPDGTSKTEVRSGVSFDEVRYELDL